MEKLLLFRCLILISLSLSAASATNNADQDSLLAFRDHITHDPTNFLVKDWNTSTPVCNWTGISCDVHSHRVTVLNVSSLDLEGSIPSQLGNLSSLQVLDLGFNRLTGAIPSTIFTVYSLDIVVFRENRLHGDFPSFTINSNMSSLRYLDLSFNSMSGEFPASICSKLPRLEYLSLSKNSFHGEIPATLSNCKHLQRLGLSYNDFSGGIRKEIGNLGELKELFLGFNRFQGEIPRELGNLANLETLHLRQNFLRGTIPSSIFKLSSLSVLDLAVNNLTGEVPSKVCDLSKLEWLHLSQNKLFGVVPYTIFNMSSLRSLGLAGNTLSGTFVPSSGFFHLPNLEELFLWGNNFSGPIPSFIFNSSKLTELHLGSNSFTGSIPSTFGDMLRSLRRLTLSDNYLTSSTTQLNDFMSSLSRCNSLMSLDLSDNSLNGVLRGESLANLSRISLRKLGMFGCNISGSVPEEIGNLTNLTAIDLGGNNLNGSIPSSLGNLQKLQFITLRENELEGSIPNSLCVLKELYYLEVSTNKLSGSIPECVGNLTSVRVFLVDSNELRSVIPATFWDLTNILFIDFSSNFLSGPLPSAIGKLKVLVTIDLSRNKFSGFIPPTIIDLKDLQILLLAHNRLQGLIPSWIGGLVTLHSLDLSHNNLSGAIPKSLEKLSDLKDLNLSFNNLEGEIPTGGSFGNFSADSFVGNKLLCGSAKLQVPACKNSKHHPSRRTALVLGIVLPFTTSLILVVIWLILRCLKGRGEVPNNEVSVSEEGTWRRFSYIELSRATDGFSEEKLIGKGGFGSVYRARLQNGTELAVKVFHQQFERALKSFDTECKVMKNIRHRNLVKIISGCSNGDFRMLVLEYMTNGNLEEALYSSNNNLNISKRLNIMIDVASALKYLHFGNPTPVIHCDLKPSNVLLDDNMVAHLSDFGIAKLLIGEDRSATQTQTLATIGYMAPEYGREGRISTKGDVYSFGILLMETFTRKKPTHEIFNGEMTLKHWVSKFLPVSVKEVADANLVSGSDIHLAANEVCVSSVLNLALECTEESADNRVNANEIVGRLLKIKDFLLTNV